MLEQLEAHLGGEPLARSFDLIYGTSTGAIIAALIGLNWRVAAITEQYLAIIPDVMSRTSAATRTAALKGHARQLFASQKFDAFSTMISIVTTNYDFNKPTIFKSDVRQAYSMKNSFKRDLIAQLLKQYWHQQRPYHFSSSKLLIQKIEAACA